VVMPAPKQQQQSPLQQQQQEQQQQQQHSGLSRIGTMTTVASRQYIGAGDEGAIVATGHDADLPPGWKAALDPTTKKTYYFNPDNGESSWSKPAANPAFGERVSL